MTEQFFFSFLKPIVCQYSLDNRNQKKLCTTLEEPFQYKLFSDNLVPMKKISYLFNIQFYAYYNTDVLNFFKGRALENLFMRMYDDIGVTTVGEIIQLSENDILKYTVPGNIAVLEKIIEQLGKVGLYLNSNINPIDAPSADLNKTKCVQPSNVLIFPRS